MKNQRKRIETIAKGDGINFIDVDVYYKLGGMNYFTGNVEKRGLYLSASPVKRQNGTTTYTAFSGVGTCVKELKRFSRKAFEEYQVDNELKERMIKQVKKYWEA